MIRWICLKSVALRVELAHEAGQLAIGRFVVVLNEQTGQLVRLIAASAIRAPLRAILQECLEPCHNLLKGEFEDGRVPRLAASFVNGFGKQASMAPR